MFCIIFCTLSGRWVFWRHCLPWFSPTLNPYLARPWPYNTFILFWKAWLLATTKPYFASYFAPWVVGGCFAAPHPQPLPCPSLTLQYGPHALTCCEVSVCCFYEPHHELHLSLSVDHSTIRQRQHVHKQMVALKKTFFFSMIQFSEKIDKSFGSGSILGLSRISGNWSGGGEVDIPEKNIYLSWIFYVFVFAC